MEILNLGYTFYRNIEGATDIDFGREIIKRAKRLKVDSKEYFDVEESLKITFKTTYPSLVIGLGYAHDTDIESDFKLGFLFDYTTGLPYIPGSSVKGAIRSMFPANKEDKERIDFINTILGKSLNYEEMYELERSIFGKSTTDSNSKDNAESKDIFYDGYFATARGGFLASDNITPHVDEITSPNPLKFLKITPDTKVILQFGLKEEDDSKISKADRLKLYTEILKWTGLGAKTNVGYGVVESVKYEYKEAVEGTIKRILEVAKSEKSNDDKTPSNSNLLEHEKLFKEQNESIGQTIKKVLKKDKCSTPNVKKALAELVKKKMEEENIWNAKSSKKNREYIESILG